MKKEYISPEIIVVELYESVATLIESSEQGDRPDSLGDPVEVGEDDLDDLIDGLSRTE